MVVPANLPGGPPALEEPKEGPSKPDPLSTEKLIDLLAEKSPAERSKIKHLHVIAYPCAIYDDATRGSFCTYAFYQLLPVFKGLNLDKFELDDPYHGPSVIEDGWGHDTTYSGINSLVRESKGWKELICRSCTDKWLNPVTFITTSSSGSEEETSRRDPQPETWDRMMRERDGLESGASVEMWVRDERGGAKHWEKVSGVYEPKGMITSESRDDGYDETPGFAIEVRIRRGDSVDCMQDGEKNLSRYTEPLKRFYTLFEETKWEEIKRTVWNEGAESDPTACL